MAKKHARSEVDAYIYIKKQLESLGWNTKNPSTNPAGQVWTQNQCLAHPLIKQAWGAKRPENVVKISEQELWVIEGKADRSNINKANDEAKSYYAKRINDLNLGIEVKLVTGIAGNDDEGWTVHNFINLNDTWQRVTINGQNTTGFLSTDDVRALLEDNTNNIEDFTPPQLRFLQAAERINKILHKGGINKNDRAKTMAALLLSVVDQPPNLNTSLSVLIGEINARSEAVLGANDKGEFAPFVNILAPTNTKNHVNFKEALVHTIQELLNLNIRSAMNSNTDVLGQFYEVFLRYGNGAKEIGIVLTPRHVTRFAVEAIGISPNDIVLDPACGTGGFLVAAYDYIRSHCTTAQINRFKVHNLFGIEQDPAVAVLAVVNMIFRGDGKNNLAEGNCFSTNLSAKTINGQASAEYIDNSPSQIDPPITRILMNPPFSGGDGDIEEHEFVTRALEFMDDGGTLFSLIPLNCLVGTKSEQVWRESELLAKNTLLSVITFPVDLFYPSASKQVAGIFVRKGFPHHQSQPVLWARIVDDGHIILKKKRLLASEMNPPRFCDNDIPEVLEQLRIFLAQHQSADINMPMRWKTAPIDFSDSSLELLPEVYLDSIDPTLEGLVQEMERLARITVSYLVRMGREMDYVDDFIHFPDENLIQTVSNSELENQIEFQSFRIEDLFYVTRPKSVSFDDHESGQVAFVSNGEGSGIVGYVKPLGNETVFNEAGIAISAMSGASLQSPPFIARGSGGSGLVVLQPRFDMTPEQLLCVTADYNYLTRWRFSWSRQISVDRIKDLKVRLPTTNGQPDETTAQTLVRGRVPYWSLVKQVLTPS